MGIKSLRFPGREFVGMALVLLGLIGFFGTQSRHFLSENTFISIANQIPDAILIAVGMTFVLLIGGIDLSVGSILGLSGAVLGWSLAGKHWSLPLAVAACLATGLICGLFNGFAVVRWSLPSFIVTLGMLEAVRGLAYLVTDSQTEYIGSAVEGIAEAKMLGLSFPFLLALVVVAVAQIVLTRSLFGRYIVAIGTNEEAVRLSGIDPRILKTTVFALSGLLTALAALVSVSRLGAADPNAGYGLELQAIAAVVIGGTSLRGGRGSVLRSFFGVLIIAILENGLAQIGAQEPVKRLVTGCVIILAVILDQYRSRQRGATA
jgi:ribose transport system permease protein